jgi:predicted anti-sigma-YlaC factor YlaD
MRCDEIRERFIDLLYDERGAAPASDELVAHVGSCPSCRAELEELRGLQGVLKTWEEEKPLRPALVPAAHARKPALRGRLWVFTQRAAMAAAVLLAFLALANAEFNWEQGRFSFKTGLMPRTGGGPDSYSKAQTLELVKQAVDDTEARMMETNYMMMQRMLETLEQERWNDMRLIRLQRSVARGGN